MALVPHNAQLGTVGAGTAQQLDEEALKEAERRQEEAKELGQKLQYIMEVVPTRITNVAGSNAGAGSGEFHQYRMARRREMMRQLRIEAEHDRIENERKAKEDAAAAQAVFDAKTAKKRAKRQRKKVSKKAKRSHGEGEALDAAKWKLGSAQLENSGEVAGDNDDEDEVAQPQEDID